jgi:hypothetical protein
MTEPQTSPTPPRLAVISCQVLEIEINHFAKDLGNIDHVEWMEQGLHNEPVKLRIELQAAIDRVESQHPHTEAIVLGYGLCSRGTEGVRTGRCRMVIARAHDCITHLLGCRKRYDEYVKQNPGTYWYSPGWNKYHLPPGKERYDKLRAEYVEKYGEDNAEYLMESEQHWFKTYDRATYVDLGVGATPDDVQYSCNCADWLDWKFDRQCGDPRLLKDMLAGNWDDDRFLVLEPGESFRMVADDRVVERVSS